MHNILKKNLHYLEKRYPSLAKHLRGTSPDSCLELVTAESGDLTARKFSPNESYRFLHGRIDPKEEARMWAEGQLAVMPRLVVIGIGLAYHVFELLKKCDTPESAYFIEADEQIFRLAMEIHDFSWLLKNTSIHFFVGYSRPALKKFFTTSLMQPFSCHIFLPVVSLYPDTYNRIIEYFEKRLCELRLAEEDGCCRPNHLSFPRGVERLLHQITIP